MQSSAGTGQWLQMLAYLGMCVLRSSSWFVLFAVALSTWFVSHFGPCLFCSWSNPSSLSGKLCVSDVVTTLGVSGSIVVAYSALIGDKHFPLWLKFETRKAYHVMKRYTECVKISLPLHCLPSCAYCGSTWSGLQFCRGVALLQRSFCVSRSCVHCSSFMRI